MIAKEPCKISFIHCLNRKTIVLKCYLVSPFYMYILQDEEKKRLSSWVELQYGILFSLIYAIPCFGFIF